MENGGGHAENPRKHFRLYVARLLACSSCETGCGPEMSLSSSRRGQGVEDLTSRSSHLSATCLGFILLTITQRELEDVE